MDLVQVGKFISELRKEKERALTIYNSGNSNRPYDFIFRFDFYEETGEDIFYDDDQYNFRFTEFKPFP